MTVDFITTGLTKDAQGREGVTIHYAFSYDSLLEITDKNPGGLEPTRTNAVIANCEEDFKLMSSWFGNVALDVTVPIPVRVRPGGVDAGWVSHNGSVTMSIDPGSEDQHVIRYLLVSEMTELFMRAQRRKHQVVWFGEPNQQGANEGSAGEGLSRALGAQFLFAKGLGNPPAKFDISNKWLTSKRDDFVNGVDFTDPKGNEKSGCALLFIYYLAVQLAFSINEIIAGGRGFTLGDVYRNLTGSSANPFPPFRDRLKSVQVITGPNLDNPYPLWARQFGIAFSGSTRSDSPLVALSRVPHQEEMFWIGANGDVSSTWRADDFKDGQWQPQFGIAFPGSVRGGSPLILLSRKPSLEEVFWIGANGDVSSTWRADDFKDGQWQPQFGIASAGSVRDDSPLILLSRKPSQEEVFWIGANGDVSSTWRADDFKDGHWQPQFGIALPGSVRDDSPLVTIARTPQREDVFWIGANGDVSSTWRADDFKDGQWQPQFGIASAGSVRDDSPLILLSRKPSQEEVFWIGANGDVSSTWRADDFKDGHWQPQFGIALPGSVRDDSPLVTIARTPQREDVFWIG